MDNESMFIEFEADGDFIFTAHWYKENDLYVLCGNASGSTKCPDGYVCWKDRGKRYVF